ncbi:MAG TPA: secondary thiamine-phosphate synthase enzyme YjbQ [Candidatus Ozemobacteraceae bacterium]|nr:secondary thiamine-phosphate synthase enzyme YjbQ [Candidatus Ozemobacteraceae bacterium]HQG28021.1 secondary thiamine-phosphate synthase enzyme YjbQ [Candidatus Ozemobacteraceae bacterium]
MLIEETVKTQHPQTLVDVTELVRSAVRKSGLKEAHVLVSVPHTTAALTINENADPDVINDILRRIERIVPTDDHSDRHAEGNSHAHLKSSLFGSCHPFIVKDGDLVLGTWQGIYLCEFDGPRTRKLLISVLAS